MNGQSIGSASQLVVQSITATTLKTSRSYSHPKRISSHFIAFFTDSTACCNFPTFSISEKISIPTFLPDCVTNESLMEPSWPATRAQRYDGFGAKNLFGPKNIFCYFRNLMDAAITVSKFQILNYLT